MAADETFVDTLSLDEFSRTLQPLLDQVFQALGAARTQPAADRPALGGFHDAQQIGDRYEFLQQEFVTRLARLANAVDAARLATAGILADYRTAEELHRAGAKDIADALRPVSKELSGGHVDAR